MILFSSAAFSSDHAPVNEVSLNFSVIQSELAIIQSAASSEPTPATALSSDPPTPNTALNGSATMKKMSGMQGKMKQIPRSTMDTMTAQSRDKEAMRNNMTTMMGKRPMTDMSMSSEQAALPGDANVPHLYHLGEADFFLDQTDQLNLTAQQIKQLTQIKLAWQRANERTADAIDRMEETVWTLTSAGKPDANKIETQIREIAERQGQHRMAFIRAVGEAIDILSTGQITALIGQYETTTQ